MICRLCLNTLDEQNAVLLFTGADSGGSDNSTIQQPENYLVQLISTHLYLCLSRDDAISTSICTDCCAQLESFHNFWKLVEHKQTTLCSQFLEIDCDVNWSEEGDVEQQQMAAITDYEQDPDPDIDMEPGGDEAPIVYDALVKEETEFHESYLKVDPKAAAAHKFPCMFCEKSFKMRRYLEEHVATHTGDRPIACAYCNMSFRCRSNMYTHVKTKHTTQWQKARADRESAKINSNNNVQIQRGLNGDNNEKLVDAINMPSSELMVPSDPHPILKISAPPPPAASAPAPPTPASAIVPASVSAPEPVSNAPSTVSIKCEPMEAINLTVAKTCPAPVKRSIRSSRRKTHSPKKVQHMERSNSASEDSSSEELADQHEKRFKSELQTCEENELMLANYNAVAAVVAAATQQQHLCASFVQQHQEQLLTAMAAVSTSTSTSSAAAAAAAAAVALTSQSSTPATSSDPAPALPAAEPYTCSICGQQLRNQRALRNHLHNKHNTTPAATATPTATPTPTSTMSSPSQSAAICAICGEPSGQNHRCSGKAKYACDVCGKSFKMKRYLEEHFATHTGVKLHTCAFCPTEFRSKSNMYHHTKRKHKLEWEHSRATRNAAKSTSTEQTQQQPQELEQLDEAQITISQCEAALVGSAAAPI